MIVYKKIYEFLENKEKTQYNQMIDYTKIGGHLNNDKIKEICKEAEDNKFYSICIPSEFIATAASFLDGPKISALIDFPKGESEVKEKLSEIDGAIINGAKEIDVVINYKLIKSEEEHENLEEEIRKITEYCHHEGVIVKIIIEIGALTYQEIETICKMCIENNADYVMTSTGKLPKDDSFETKLEKVKFMRKILPDEIKIKFSGGIRNIEQIKELKSIVDRIGTSQIISN
jgi:deoxyribose-phosphate aldolase